MTNTTKIEETTLKGIDGFFDKLTEVADIFSTKIIEVAPEAAEAILNLIQFKGIFNIGVGLVLFVIPTLVLFFFYKRFQDWNKQSDYLDVAPIFVGAGGFIGIAGFYIASLRHVLSFYNWISAFYPEGAVALKALEAAGIIL